MFSSSQWAEVDALRALQRLGLAECGPGLVDVKLMPSLKNSDGSDCPAVGMELGVRGEDLSAFLDRLDSVERRVCAILQPLLGCVARLHGANLVHGDLKSHNVIVVDSAKNLAHQPTEVRLIDFELAALLDSTTATTTRYTGYGTTLYIAPEVYDKRPYGLAADVYSLGVLLLAKVLGGRLPEIQIPIFPTSADSERSTDSRYDRRTFRPLSDTELYLLVKSAGEAAGREGQHLQRITDIIAEMVNEEPGKRPSVRNVLERVRPLLAGASAAKC